MRSVRDGAACWARCQTLASARFVPAELQVAGLKSGPRSTPKRIFLCRSSLRQVSFDWLLARQCGEQTILGQHVGRLAHARERNTGPFRNIQ
jgi:hypothetical protein